MIRNAPITVCAILRVAPNMASIRDLQRQDPEIQLLIQAKQINGIPPGCPSESVRHIRRNKDKYTIVKEVLYCKQQNRLKLVVPTANREHLLVEYHVGCLGGHLSAKKVFK